jgi:hypothetical protein
MATVPGPQPDAPLPIPGEPGEEIVHESEEQGTEPYRGDDPDWLPRPYEPEREREYEEFAEPVAP